MPQYMLTEIKGFKSGAVTCPNDINDSVVTTGADGNLFPDDAMFRIPFVYSNGTIADFEAAPGEGISINASGDIAGQLFVSGPSISDQIRKSRVRQKGRSHHRSPRLDEPDSRSQRSPRNQRRRRCRGSNRVRHQWSRVAVHEGRRARGPHDHGRSEHASVRSASTLRDRFSVHAHRATRLSSTTGTPKR